jgi:Flp pilus assembly secretin CpaC
MDRAASRMRRTNWSGFPMARRLATIAACAIFLAAPALAGTEVVLVSDQAKMISIPGEPGTVVVGNPSIADVTIQGENVFLHGRNYGSTNVIFLDRDGRQLAALDVIVTNAGTRDLNIFRAGSRFSYNCVTTCEATTQVGDNAEYFKGAAEQGQLKGGLATGASKTTE